MHELSVATELYRQCRDEIARRGGGCLLGVQIAVGELSAVEPDLLKYAWEAVTAEGSDKDAELEIDWKRVRQVCAACGEVDERQDGGWLRLCPDCDQVLALEGGRELDILTLTFDDQRGDESRR